MLRRLRKNEEATVEEANVLPVMNIMFLLIPALLLAMEVASMAAVAVSPPKISAEPSPEQIDKPKNEGLNLKVFIMADGYRVSSAGQQHGAEVGKAVDSSNPTIPLAKPGAPADDYDRYDFAALSAMVADLRTEFPTETVVTVSAENDIPAQVLINTLDALRGFDCKLGSLHADEALPDTCMFIHPVVEAGAG